MIAPSAVQLAEFRRLYREANEVALSHDEFLILIFRAAVEVAAAAQADDA